MSQEKYSIFDEMIEGVQIVNSDWQYVYVNNTVATQGKYSKQELLGHTMMEKYPGIDNTEMFQRIKDCLSDRQHHQMVNEFNFPDGSVGYFQLRMEPIAEGVLILSFDVTAQKRAEKILQNNNAELEEKVLQRTKELMNKNKELEQFAYIASHDLQEPIRTVSNYIEVLKEDYREQLDETALNYLEVISKSNHRMSVLTTALLDYSRLGRNKEKVEVKVSILLQEVLADLEQVLHQTGAEVNVKDMPVLDGYEVELRQLFQNLLTNAIKFRKETTVPKITISSETLPNGWMFHVQDNGIGIDKVYHARIFDIFQRLHDRTEYEGSGIGLANCKKIVELHKGFISVQSEIGKGSTFSFTLLK